MSILAVVHRHDMHFRLAILSAICAVTHCHRASRATSGACSAVSVHLKLPHENEQMAQHLHLHLHLRLHLQDALGRRLHRGAGSLKAVLWLWPLWRT